MRGHASSCWRPGKARSEEHTSELQSRSDLVCRLLLEKKKIVVALLGRLLLLHSLKLEAAETQRLPPPQPPRGPWKPLFLVVLSASVYLAAPVLLDGPA